MKLKLLSSPLSSFSQIGVWGDANLRHFSISSSLSSFPCFFFQIYTVSINNQPPNPQIPAIHNNHLPYNYPNLKIHFSRPSSRQSTHSQSTPGPSQAQPNPSKPPTIPSGALLQSKSAQPTHHVPPNLLAEPDPQSILLIFHCFHIIKSRLTKIPKFEFILKLILLWEINFSDPNSVL